MIKTVRRNLNHLSQLEIVKCSYARIKKYNCDNCDYSILTEHYAVISKNETIGAVGFVKCHALGVDRILNLAISIDRNHRGYGHLRNICNIVNNLLVNESPTGKIWVITELKSPFSKAMAPEFGLKPVGIYDYYLKHNTDNDQEAIDFAIGTNEYDGFIQLTDRRFKKI